MNRRDRMDNYEKRQERCLIIILIAIFILAIIIIFCTKGCSSFYQEPTTTKDSNRPFVVTESSCWWGDANGTFTVETKKYGLLCKGNSYHIYRDSYSNPLVICSKGQNIIVHLKGTEEKTVTIAPKSEQLVQCSFGVASTYLYVKVN